MAETYLVSEALYLANDYYPLEGNYYTLTSYKTVLNL